MTKVFMLFLLALCVGACTRPVQSDRPEPVFVGPGTEAVPFAYRPGEGVIESVWRVDAPGTAAAGGGSLDGTVGRTMDGVAYRLAVRMNDGTTQTVLQDNPGFEPGDRVRLTDDGRVIRLERMQ